MKKTFITTAVAAILVAFASPAHAESNAELVARIDKLEQELQLLKRKAEVSDEVATANSQKNATVAFDKKGLQLSSPDKNFTARLGGVAMLDSRTFIDDQNRTSKDDLLIRQLRPVIEGTIYNDFSYRFMPDFAGSTKIQDAYIDYKISDPLNIRAGKFKPPIGLERLQSPTDTFFTENGEPTNLVPNRDLGIQVFGEIIPQTLEYQLAITSGAPDLGNNDANDDTKYDYSARIFGSPFRSSDIVALQGLGVGVGGSVGVHKGTGTSAATSVLPTYKTAGQQNFFSYKNGSFADGDSWRLAPQGYYYYGNKGLLGEYTLSSQDVTNGANSAKLLNKAWQIAGSYVLTGEDASFKGVIPDEVFNPSNNQWGAFELVARVGATDVDNDAFPLFADKTKSASKEFGVGGGLNWYFNENLKLMFDYENTAFNGGDAGGKDKPDENLILSRLQVKL